MIAGVFPRRCYRELATAGVSLQKLYRNNSDLISSLNNVFLNTVLLTSKLIKATPPIIPRVAFTLLSFSGMISINMQARNWSKHMLDWRFALRFRNYPAMAITAVKVCIKGSNILLTSALFAGSIISLVGFPQITLVMFKALQPIALVSLIGSVSGEVVDFITSKRLLSRLHKLPSQTGADVKIQQVAQNFLFFAYQSPYRKMDARIQINEKWKSEQRLALDIVRQMEGFTLERFKDGLAVKSIGRYSTLTPAESLHVFQSIEKALRQSHTFKKANIGLTALGYVSMGICRLFPQSIVQYGLTLTMSLFYTGKMICEKYLLKQLKSFIAKK